MEIIILAILVLLAFVGISSWLKKKRNQDVIEEKPREIPVDCCGSHEVCEKDSLLSFDNRIVYYEDEELDKFQEKQGNSYNDQEVELFEDILLSLRESEVAAWLKSLQLRGINPPDLIREQALLIVADRRNLL